MSEKLYEIVKQGKYTAQDRLQDDEFKNFDRGDLIALIEAQKERIGELLADKPQGEWIDKGDYAVCSNCGAHSGTQYDGVEPIPLKTNFCPNCGARMRPKLQGTHFDSIIIDECAMKGADDA